ncbi:MAG: RNA polymerase sigma-70 factor (ECF subfamily) [Chlamydiales bacterium]|jgi:RNA polymerase sigma-70 factor (ECF subfamily)
MMTQPGAETDNDDLWIGVCEQREGAFERLQALIREVCSMVFRHSMVPNNERERLLQDVLVSVWEFAGKQNEAPRNLRAFLKWRARGVLSVLRRELQARRREDPVDSEMPIADENALPLDSVVADEMTHSFQLCRNRLTPVLAAVWDARYERHLDPAATAEELGIPAGTVAVRLHRAKDALMECLRGKGVVE